jgi:hypothetical protein
MWAERARRHEERYRREPPCSRAPNLRWNHVESWGQAVAVVGKDLVRPNVLGDVEVICIAWIIHQAT